MLIRVLRRVPSKPTQVLRLDFCLWSVGFTEYHYPEPTAWAERDSSWSLLDEALLRA